MLNQIAHLRRTLMGQANAHFSTICCPSKSIYVSSSTLSIRTDPGKLNYKLDLQLMGKVERSNLQPGAFMQVLLNLSTYSFFRRTRSCGKWPPCYILLTWPPALMSGCIGTWSPWFIQVGCLDQSTPYIYPMGLVPQVKRSSWEWWTISLMNSSFDRGFLYNRSRWPLTVSVVLSSSMVRIFIAPLLYTVSIS